MLEHHTDCGIEFVEKEIVNRANVLLHGKSRGHQTHQQPHGARRSGRSGSVDLGGRADLEGEVEVRCLHLEASESVRIGVRKFLYGLFGFFAPM